MNIGAVAGAGATPDKPATLREAAGAFEALFVGQLLKSAREAGQEGGLGESDQASATMMEVAEEHLSREVTRNGGLGLAQLIVSQLERPAGVTPPGRNTTPPGSPPTASHPAGS